MAVSIYVAAELILHALVCAWAASALSMLVCNIVHGVRFRSAELRGSLLPEQLPAVTRLKRVWLWSLAVCISSFFAMAIIVVAIKPLDERYRNEWAFGLLARPKGDSPAPKRH
jgi:hypothetical protein